MMSTWSPRRALLPIVMATAVLTGAGGGLLAVCGPFTDVAADSFCPFVLEIFTLGITTGTSATTYDPASSVTRIQMAAFLSRSVDGVLKRGSRRAALDQFWTTQSASSLGVTTLGGETPMVRSDGADLWVTNDISHTVSRVRASDGKLLETWTGSTAAVGVLVAMGRIFVTGELSTGALYRIDPSQPAGTVTTVASNLGAYPIGIAFDGARIWTANNGPSGVSASISIVTPAASIPWTVTTVTTGFVALVGALYDGANVWVTDANDQALKKLDGAGAILQSVSVGATPQFPVFDGANIWVPNGNSASVTVVRAATGAVLVTLTGNGLSVPGAAAFDGQRVLVTNETSATVSLWKAADLSPLGSFGVGSNPFGAGSDGAHFWITFFSGKLSRF